MRRNVFNTSSYDPNCPSGKKFVSVHVQNEDPLYFLVEVKSKVCELFAQITKFLNLLEPELFGVAIRTSGSYVFLDPLEKLSKYAPKPWRTQNNGMDNEGIPLFNVYFRVQFYVDSYLFISDKIAKLLYYHQMRENVLYYGMALSEERAFLLASYALQADYGNYSGALQGSEHYFTPGHYFPAWVVERLGVEYISRHLPTLHLDHAGMSKSEAQSMYIKEASDAMAPHNFHLYPLAVKKGSGGTGHGTSLLLHSSGTPTTAAAGNSSGTVSVWLAITISGIAIYGEECHGGGGSSRKDSNTLAHNSSVTSTASSSTTANLDQSTFRSSALKTRISFFPWSDIGKLSFEKKKFEIRSTGPQGRKFVYHSASEEISRHLLWFSRASHQFHLMVQQKMKEMLKREAEISRRKYRESCISSTTTASSSAGTTSSAITAVSSSSSSSSGNSSGSGSTPSSSNSTSKSASPFEFSNASSSSSSGSLNGGPAAEVKLLSSPADNAASCSGEKLALHSGSSGAHHPSVSATTSNGSSVLCDAANQRVSVISNASSNTTTSGIVSDKSGVGGVGLSGLGSERSQDSDREDLDLLDGEHHHHHHHDDDGFGTHHHNHLHHHNLHHHNLHHHHHHHGVINRAITLSGCSSQPVVSLESLALSEPIEHRSCRGGKSGECGGKLGSSGKGGLAANKKHSISISNIMITSSTTPTSTCSMATSGISSSSSSSSTGSDHLDHHHHDDHHPKCPVSASSCLDSSYASSEVSSSTSASPVANLPSSSPPPSSAKATSITVPSSSFPATEKSAKHEVLVTTDLSSSSSTSSSVGSKVLRLNINETSLQEDSAGDEGVSGDESSTGSGSRRRKHRHSSSSSSLHHHHHHHNHHHHRHNRSNVTVLSTILKPEAERLLKQAGIEVTTSSADEAAEQLMIAQQSQLEQAAAGEGGHRLDQLDHPAGLDSSQLAELKEFEQAEKEKIILNSLINKLPPPPPMSSSEEEDSSDAASSSSDSSSDSSDDSSDDSEDEEEGGAEEGGAARHCYSPLSMEKQAHNSKHRKPIRSAAAAAAATSAACRGASPKKKLNATDLSSADSPLSSKFSSNQHIYENLKSPVTVNNSSSSISGSCKTLSEWRNLAQLPPAGLPPPVPLRPTSNGGHLLFSTPKPATAAAVVTPCLTPHRTGMRIGVSSLSRPYGGPRTKHSLLGGGGGCVQTPTGVAQHSGAGGCGCSATPRRGTTTAAANNLFDVSAGSEPNLYWQSNATSTANGWPSAGCPRALAANKSDSVFDCRVIGAATSGGLAPSQMPTNGGYYQHQRQHLLQPMMSASPVAASTTANGFSSLPPSGDAAHHHHPQLTQQDSNNNIEKESAPAAYFLRSPMTTATTTAADHHHSTPNTASQQNHQPKQNSGSAKGSPNKADSINDLHQLRQRSSDLNLPLITALFNDSSLMDQLSEQQQQNQHRNGSSLNKMSQSMSQIPQRLSSSPSDSGHHNNSYTHHYSNNSGGGGGHHHHHPSGATVERTSTFRVDEAIAKSTLRQQHQQQQQQLKANDNNNNLPDYTTANTNSRSPANQSAITRPISWHLEQPQFTTTTSSSSSTCSGQSLVHPNGHLGPHLIYQSPPIGTVQQQQQQQSSYNRGGYGSSLANGRDHPLHHHLPLHHHQLHNHHHHHHLNHQQANAGVAKMMIGGGGGHAHFADRIWADHQLTT